MEERLQKYISSSGCASRRESENLIKEGVVTVNDVVVTELGTKVTEKDIVKINGKIIKPQENKVYYMLNKPTGYLTTSSDSKGRRTIYDLLIGLKDKVYPVGRLDYDTSGLILLTNDSEFKMMIEKPSVGIKKEYHVKIEGLLRKEESFKIQKGVDLGDYKTKPCKIINVEYNDEKTKTSLDIIISEGKNREIRRLFESVSHRVISLKRTRIGNLELDINQGKYRSLTPHEVKLLKLLSLNKIKEDKKK